MRTLLCCIGRQENKYIREFVEYYKNLGFTNICLYDNNRKHEERFEDVIGDYIDSGYVILKNWRDKELCQLHTYNDCYAAYQGDYDWFAFFDCDEFLTFKRHDTVDEYLSQPKFSDYDVISVNWMCYGDNGIIMSPPSNSVLDVYTEPIQYDTRVLFTVPINTWIKVIVKSGSDMRFDGCTSHFPSGNFRNCNAQGRLILNPSRFLSYNYDEAWLRHYATKSTEDYALKLLRGYPDYIVDDRQVKNLIVNYYFQMNRPTNDKVRLFNSMIPGLGLSIKDFMYMKLHVK